MGVKALVNLDINACINYNVRVVKKLDYTKGLYTWKKRRTLLPTKVLENTKKN